MSRKVGKKRTRALSWSKAFDALTNTSAHFLLLLEDIKNAIAFRLWHVPTGDWGNWLVFFGDLGISPIDVVELCFQAEDEFGSESRFQLRFPKKPDVEYDFNFIEQCDARFEERLFLQDKKRQWGLFIKLKRSSRTRSKKQNRECIRVPHR